MEGTVATGAGGELPTSPKRSQLQKLLQQMGLEKDELQTKLTQAQVSAHNLYIETSLSFYDVPRS